MVRNSSTNADIRNNSDGGQIGTGVIQRVLKWLGSDITFTGFGSAVHSFPPGTDTLAGLGTIQTWSAAQTIPTLLVNTISSGQIVGTTTNGELIDSGYSITILNKLSGINTLPKGLYSYYFDANNANTTETDLYNNSILAGQLINVGDRIVAQYAGTFTGAVASTQQLRAYFNGTLIFDSGSLNITATTNSWDLILTIINVDGTSARCSVVFNSDFSSLTATSTYTEITSLNFAGADTELKITGTAAGAGADDNQITASQGYVEYRPSS